MHYCILAISVSRLVTPVLEINDHTLYLDAYTLKSPVSEYFRSIRDYDYKYMYEKVT